MPKLGQTIHYHDHQGRTYAAFVTRVHSETCVDIVALDASGALGAATVAYPSVEQAPTYGERGNWSYEWDDPADGEQDVEIPLAAIGDKPAEG